MRFRHPAWEPISWVLAVVNLAGVWFAAVPAEPLHATAHALLAAGFAVGASTLSARRRGLLGGMERDGLLDEVDEADRLLDSMQARVQELEDQLVVAERLLAQQRIDDLGGPHATS